MKGSAPFPDDALERSIREYYQRREAPSAPFERSWAALKTALDAEPAARGTPVRFNAVMDVAGGDEDYAFILEDALEDPMHGDDHNRPTTTVPSPRMETRRRGLSPRATAIAAIAAALILVIIAATIFTQIAIRRMPHPAATPTLSAMNKIALPNASARQIAQMTTAPDGSLWFTDSGSQTPKISHVAPDGTLTEFPIPINEKVRTVFIASIVVGPDGAIWFSSSEYDGTDYTLFLTRMTPNGVFTPMPVPAGLLLGILFTGPDGGLWFSGFRPLDNGSPPAAYRAVYGTIAPDGHITEYPYQGSPGSIESLCVGPDKAIWYAVLDLNDGTDLTHLTGRIVRQPISGQVQEFAVPHGPNSIASGSDGALWFSEYSEFVTGGDGTIAPVSWKGSIGHITTAGVVSEIPIDPNLAVDQVVASSDGAIWFTVGQDETGKFGRITPSGGVKTFTTGGNSRIVKIAAAAGALWLLDGRNVLWHYHLPG